MFGLIRSAILVLFAFFAGIMFERANASKACAEAGGDWTRGVCLGTDERNE